MRSWEACPLVERGGKRLGEHVKASVSILIAGAVLAARAWACDLCAVYSAAQSEIRLGKGVFAGLAEQYSQQGTLQRDGQEVANAWGQYLDSSISQVFAGYNFSERVGVQFNLPVLSRAYQRPDGLGGIKRGVVWGLGDVSLLGHLVALSHQTERSELYVNLVGGIKFPTGNTDRLGEEANEVPEPVGQPSAVHGHDLTLGSGSVDGLVGATVLARRDRSFVNASAQCAIRSQGDHDYQFANDVVWAGGPGYYLVLNERQSLNLQAVVSGEYKGLDTFEGRPASDTGVTMVYLGPQVNYTWTDRLSAHVAVDLPVSRANTGLQTVTDFRVRGGLTWRF